jgi:hypothetical protein
MNSGKMDMDERKRAEAAIIESEIRYRRLFETAKDGILLLDADSGQITDVNPSLSCWAILSKNCWEKNYGKSAHLKMP